ncbi:hypothetical protein VC83_07159 [Pseudogymnoascus destructans]|uniref:Uncharacterized protein n=1 Tax=Pseudogymnoascus destructans TaxID=655981 RepID=A0A177A5B6_9PEZI|nr:uncharacterized protein VC83_07159 [Pseudogymnoascus destructans]OAF56682.1 hypothetical protein VC83_07159 [Pseudogymnoascus destructans]
MKTVSEIQAPATTAASQASAPTPTPGPVGNAKTTGSPSKLTMSSPSQSIEHGAIHRRLALTIDDQPNIEHG